MDSSLRSNAPRVPDPSLGLATQLLAESRVTACVYPHTFERDILSLPTKQTTRCFFIKKVATRIIWYGGFSLHDANPKGETLLPITFQRERKVYRA